MTLFWDIDGTIRELDKLVLGKELPYWNYKLDNGKGFCDIINDNLSILEIARPYKDYLEILNKQEDAIFLTHQPENWRAYTEKWLKKWIKIPYKIIYVNNNIEEKLEYLITKKDYLIDDYPLFTSYHNIILIDRLWNRGINVKTRIKNKKELKNKLKKI